MNLADKKQPSNQWQTPVASAVLLMAFLSMAAADVGAQSPPEAIRITIQSDWAGFSVDSPLKTGIVLEHQDKRYRLTGTSSRGYAESKSIKKLPPRYVEAVDVKRLITALRAPAQSQVDLKAIGLNDRKAQDAIEREWLRTGMTKLPAATRAKADAFRDSQKKREVLASTITRGFDARHTDDAPYVVVKVELSDGSKLTICSTSQQPFMLPWKDASDQVTYNVDIPRAIAALLPDAATNKERLVGRIDEFSLRELVGEGLRNSIGRFRAEAEARPALQALEAHFKVNSADPLPASEDKGARLVADLQLPGAPTNLVLSARLALRDGALIESEHDIARIAAALTLAESAPALATRMKARPSSTFRMNDRFGWEWLNQKTANQFVQQMQAMHKLPELGNHPDLMNNAVMVLEGDNPSYWIVLPDHRAVLWKSFTKEEASAGTMRCASVPMGMDDDDDKDDSFLTDLCQGIVYGSDGQLMP